MIVVTGATGHLGALVTEQLTERVGAGQVIATARRPEALAALVERGVTVRQLDYDRPETIGPALEGAEQVLLISGTEVASRVDQHRAVIEGAATAGIAHLAYTSILRADTSTMSLAADHVATERLLAEAPYSTSRLRHGWYIENYTEQLESALANGAFVGSAGDGKIAAATRADYAAADVEVLLDRNLWGGTFELAGEPFTMAELASTVSVVVGRSIPYVDVPVDELREIYGSAGIPAPLAEVLADSDRGVAEGQLDAPSATLRGLIGHDVTTLAEVVGRALTTRVTS